MGLAVGIETSGAEEIIRLRNEHNDREILKRRFDFLFREHFAYHLRIHFIVRWPRAPLLWEAIGHLGLSQHVIEKEIGLRDTSRTLVTILESFGTNDCRSIDRDRFRVFLSHRRLKDRARGRVTIVRGVSNHGVFCGAGEC